MILFSPLEFLRKFVTMQFCRLLQGRRAHFSACLMLTAVFGLSVQAQADLEGRNIESIAVVVDGAAQGSINETYGRTIREILGSTYAAVKIRDSIEQLYQTDDISTVEVAAERAGERVALRFNIRRKARAQRVSIQIAETQDAKITEQELLFRLNLLDPGAVVTAEALDNNANLILEYLRERGFLRARVTYERQQLETPNDVEVTFQVTPGEPARVESFNVAIDGFNAAKVKESLKLEPGEIYTREKLNADSERIRNALIEQGFLAPTINEPRPVYNNETNTITIEVSGRAGPRVEVVVTPEDAEVGNRTKRRLLPVTREGTLDFAAIIEGERRLENYYQEQGYFFADVSAVCAVVPVTPPGAPTDAAQVPGTEAACSSLSSADFTDRKAIVKYVADLDRRLKLTDIRLQGTSLFTIEEILSVLDSQRANILGIIPLFGYGRGYTSARILEQDTATIRSLLRELGYRDATVRVNRGVSPDGENLIITFIVEQGEPTLVSGVEIQGNTAFSDAELSPLLPKLEGVNFSRAKVRNGQRRLAEFYSNKGYYDATIDFSVDQNLSADGTPSKEFKIIYSVRNEGKPVQISRILVTGNERTKSESVLRAVVLEEGTLLKAADVYLSEQNLYESDAFSLVEIRPQAAGERPDARLVDVIVNVVEQAPRIATYGGGYSTDFGASGFVDLRHFNLFGRLWQGGVRVSVSELQQLLQIDFVDPRFLRDKEKRFSPLTVSAQYQRDSTVTRFFRSAFDRGTFGIVQRVDEDGNPIDELGVPAGDPTLNRITFTAETNRTLSREKRSVAYFRYRFEDARLLNIESLLIRDLLLPDSRIRTSGFGVTFVRDTRENCSMRFSILDIIEKGEVTEPCRYSASDPTRGDYLTAEYNVSVPALGANVGFNKFQASYNFFYTFPVLRNTTFAARTIIGLANVFKEEPEPRFSPVDFPGLENILPISERFFAGGGSTLRGFDFESAGPRVVVAPAGEFRNSNGEIVFLNPFTVPFGGNALVIANLEARIPVSRLIRFVPFYDGGNVFRRVGDIFGSEDVPDSELFRRNLDAKWTHTVGLGLRIKTPVGAEFGIDYAYLLNPPTFLIPQPIGPPANFTLPPSKLHFRFSQAF